MKYFLLDKIIAFEKGSMAQAIKCITFSEDILHDHFPDFPVMPGAMLVEAAAQLGSFLFEMSINENEKPVRRSILVQIDKAKFHHFVEPGERLLLTARLDNPSLSSTRCPVVIESDEKKISSLTLTLASRQIQSEHLHRQRRRIYRIWTRGLDPAPVII